MTEVDLEAKAIGEISAVVGSLEEDQRSRVVRYIMERFKIGPITGAPKGKKASDDSDPAAETAGESEYADFASLHDAAGPNTDSLRALVSGYWLQVCQKAASFDGQSVNTELKHLGHPIANITNALSTLINQKPALVLQLRKSGNTKQARKLYKLTEAGTRRVKKMIAGDGDDE